MKQMLENFNTYYVFNFVNILVDCVDNIHDTCQELQADVSVENY